MRCVLALAAAVCLATSGPAATAGELSNRRAPSFNLPDGRLQRYDTQDLRGKVVLLEFMSTTCPYCAKLS